LILDKDRAIEYLGKKANEEDVGESAHWRHYHSEFTFTGDGFVGIQGFGGSDAPYTGLRKLAHRILQNRYRQIGASFPNFQKVNDSAARITTAEARAFDLDVLRQAITASYLDSKIGGTLNSNSISCVIGDGFGSMTSILLESKLSKIVVLVNLNKTLLVDLWFLRKWIESEGRSIGISLLTEANDIDKIRSEILTKKEQHIIAIQAENHNFIQDLPIDIAINIVSMQEMDPEVINAYFGDLRLIASQREIYFYCCNREMKELPDGTITRFAEYPWQENDRILEDNLCPWHQRYYTLKPPFYRSYDGPIRHRLVKLGANKL